MKQFYSILLIYLVLFLGANYADAKITESDTAQDMQWKAGVAKVKITPEQSMWMAGYGSRDHPSEGTLHDVWVKALALEDADGRQAVLVTSDLLGLPKAFSDRVRDRLEENYGLSKAQILLNSSHTHSAPVLHNTLVDVYPLDSRQENLIEQYTRELEDQIVMLIGEALQSMEPARLYSENGVVRFAVNRRNNSSSRLEELTELAGPSDHAVPVIKVENSNGDLMAVTFGYACHPTVLSFYQWSGDYPGFAQIELENAYPEAMAMFFQGAGADQNPMPRRTVPLAEQYGQELAAAVKRVLNEEMRPLTASLATAYSEIDLKFGDLPTKEELMKIAEESSGYQNRWAQRMIEKQERGEAIRTSYPYPVQVWQLGEQTMVGLGGELVVDYSVEIKRIFGQDTFVMGYSNDVMSYIPSARIIREGGYEGASSQMVYGLPTKWDTSIETDILSEVVRLSEQIESLN